MKTTTTVSNNGIKNLTVKTPAPLADYRAAMVIADKLASKHMGEAMLLSWYDNKDRDFESPQHASECHQDSAIPGYVDYGINHGASLKIDIEDGRFVFFYLSLESNN
ncbi:MAG: AF1514 family protein [Acidiferrobacterales bacterium]